MALQTTVYWWWDIASQRCDNCGNITEYNELCHHKKVRQKRDRDGNHQTYIYINMRMSENWVYLQNGNFSQEIWCWLVVYLPFSKIWVRQLGLLFPTEWKIIKFMFQTTIGFTIKRWDSMKDVFRCPQSIVSWSNHVQSPFVS